ncbi:hypothetical protein ES319_D01G009500v1 [Gossypium barbadense]|uniref:Uncharacterized protein n=3 Tax=Gossypium TaxID=3633 RepID=A0A5J5SIP6_GOSBA|nr:hypothetical protein ES319_D01G009500v1 [Gossypium barbadense]KAB2043342.1 hypothetical protein ES319_D01G009500v1 [Gossypium barbadense]KAB2043343.1 hypothetical protein ES319_D01G009500v1 [Gossypium barbadense]TYG81505.1 hypothetical protein ES288_D01G010200v1 [Gossypium darwinii]
MGLPNASGDLSTEVEVDAFRRLFPLHFYEKHLLESIRPDAPPLGRAREATIALGVVASANGSTLSKVGSTRLISTCFQLLGVADRLRQHQSLQSNYQTRF